MSYTLQRSDASNPPIYISDESIGSSPPLTIPLVGRNYINYGDVVDQSMLHLLENFRSPIPPQDSIPGQIWYDDATKTVKVNVGDDDGTANAVWNQLLTFEGQTQITDDPGIIGGSSPISNAIQILQSISVIDAPLPTGQTYTMDATTVDPRIIKNKNGSPYTIDPVQAIALLIQAIIDLQTQIDTYHP